VLHLFAFADVFAATDGELKMRKYPAPDTIGDRVLFSIDFFVYFFISFFVSLSARLRESGWTDLHEIQGRCGLTMGRPDYILGQCRETA